MPVHKLSNKKRNNLIRATNGNINKTPKTLKIQHWNLGSRFWSNKTDDIQSLVDEMNPHLCLISEANLFDGLYQHLALIHGYEIITTASMKTKGYSRLVLLVRDDVKVEIQEQWMNDDKVASIWLKIRRRGCKPVTVGGVYREHSLLLQGVSNDTDRPEAQSRRWKKFIDQWTNARQDGICHVLGDTNLDIFKWTDPESINEQMVKYMNEEIVTLNFSQIIEGFTRSWPGTEDSLLDQCWTNRLDLILSKNNIVRYVGDHNVIEIVLKLKGTDEEQQESRRRNWKLFSLENYVSAAAAIRWDDFYRLTDLNEAQYWMETSLSELLDKEAPWMTVQPRRKFRNWVSAKTK